MGKILSTGILGNTKELREKNPFIVKNKAKIAIYLFIDMYTEYIILHYNLRNLNPKKVQVFCYLLDE